MNDFTDSDIIIPEFACEEIEISLFDTPAGSAPSKDGSAYEDIKKNWNEKKEEIRNIFNVIRYYKRAPRGWKHELVCRIPKKNFDSNDLSTLRDISLIPCLYKLFIKCLLKRITAGLLDNAIGF